MAKTSIKEVADIAGVSIATVSRCVNNPAKVTEPTRLRVQEAISQTGYQPSMLARQFRRGRTNQIVVTMPCTGNPYVAELMCGIHDIAKTKGYTVLVEEVGPDAMSAEQVTATLATNRADGILLLASICPVVAEEIARHVDRGVRIVSGHRRVSEDQPAYPAVHIDNVAAAGDATKYLISQGHTRIAMIGGPDSLTFAADREAGYRSAMSESGLPIRPEWVVKTDLTIDDAVRAASAVLSIAERPTALFCVTDELAIAALHVISAANLKVPDDISVIGFDDIRFAAVSNPPLTTILQPARVIGERLMERICLEIEGGSTGPVEPDLIPHELIIRESVGKPPV
jgi:LacI family repressor for deo operon, udp, cdd, tsx, nupC, and nupG